MIEIKQLLESEIIIASDLIETIFGNYSEVAHVEFSRLFQNQSHPTYVFLAWKDSKPIGIGACLETYFSFDMYGICWVGVLEEYRNNGICTALFDHIETFIKADLLNGKKGTVILTADSAIQLYKKLGYVQQIHSIHDGSFLMSKILN